MKRILLVIGLVGLFGSLVGCDRFAEEPLLEEPVVEGRTPMEGTFVATVAGGQSVGIAGSAFFRIPGISRNRLSLDFWADAGVSDGTGVFLSTAWHRQAEEALPSSGYANLALEQADNPAGKPTSLIVTAGSITLTSVTEDRIAGTFSVSAREAAAPPEAEQMTIVGAFIALRHAP